MTSCCPPGKKAGTSPGNNTSAQAADAQSLTRDISARAPDIAILPGNTAKRHATTAIEATARETH